jgi:hypothetical protein
MGGAPSGGGGTTTSNTTNQMLPWSGYVPPETYAQYAELLGELGAKSDVGLNPEEKFFYTQQGLQDVGKAYAGAKNNLSENLARSGARGGAVTEAFGNLERSNVQGKSQMISNLQGMDISQKQANTDRLLKAIALPGSPVTTGTSGVTAYSPSKSSSGGS